MPLVVLNGIREKKRVKSKGIENVAWATKQVILFFRTTSRPSEDVKETRP